VSILKKEDLLSIVILPYTDKKKLNLLLLWLFAWTTCGVIVMANYFRLTDHNTKLFVIIYLSFWAYYEYIVVKAFMWRKSGKEKIWIKGGVFFYQKEVNGRGKIKEYDISLINDLKVIEVKDGNFSDYLNKSFWITGGERLEMACQSKLVRFGMQLSDKEAGLVLKDLSQQILSVLDKR
ncbi:MAG: hypothetical protein H0W61_13045, partial [Bacteroidetes bacterium]|nr:hypothetical protein [Bacteroidota bacterium]